MSIKPAIAKQKLTFGALSHEISILVLGQLLTHQPVHPILLFWQNWGLTGQGEYGGQNNSKLTYCQERQGRQGGQGKYHTPHTPHTPPTPPCGKLLARLHTPPSPTSIHIPSINKAL
ncbi:MULTISPECIES: hypothetical protein [Fischerella]|uniref:hypothetical protein n=1 Tax=Fischerella TaxID=1190 RepID=UPI0015D85B11|nr:MULTISPECIES: hypothetical protein [Fischerella]